MFPRIFQSVPRIYNGRFSNKNTDQELMVGEIKWLLKIIQLLPVSEYAKYKLPNDQERSMAFIFATIDCVEGLEHLAEYDPELLFEDSGDETPFYCAIKHDSRKVIQYFLQYFPERIEKILDHPLKRALVEQDENKVNDVLKNPSYFNGDVFMWAVGLKHEGVLRHFLPIQGSTSMLIDGIHHALVLNYQEFSAIILEHVFQNESHDMVKQFIDVIYQKLNIPSFFLKQIIDKIKQHATFSTQQVIDLIKKPVIHFFEKAVYESDEEFKQDFRSISSFVPDPDYKKEMKEILRDIMANFAGDRLHADYPLMMRFAEKLLLCGWGSFDLFESTSTPSCRDLLHTSLTLFKGKPLLFFYYLNKNSMLHRSLKDNNTWLHIAVKSNHFAAFYELVSSNRAWLLEKNADGKTPLDLCQNNSHFLTIDDTDWKVFHSIASKFYVKNSYFHYLVNDPNWGLVPRMCVELFTQCSKGLVRISEEKMKLNVLSACYDEISDFLFMAIDKIWSSTGVHQAPVAALLKLYYVVGKHHHLLQKKNQWEIMPAFFARFGAPAFALSVHMELSAPAHVFHTNRMKLIQMGLIANQFVRQAPASYCFHSAFDFDISNNVQFIPIVAIVFNLLTTTGSCVDLSKEQLTQFQNQLEEVQFSIENKMELIQHNLVTYFFDGCRAMLEWSSSFFDVPKEKEMDCDRKQLLYQIKYLMLEKINFLFSYIVHLFDQYGNHFLIESLDEKNSCVNRLNKMITETQKELEKLGVDPGDLLFSKKKEKSTPAVEGKPKKAKKKRRIKRKDKEDKCEQFPEKPTKKENLSRYRPDFSGDKGIPFKKPPMLSNRLTSLYRFQPRFFHPKEDSDYAPIRAIEALNLESAVCQMHSGIRSIIIELADVCGNYFKTINFSESLMQEFFKISQDVKQHPYSIKECKEFLFNLLDWIRSETLILGPRKLPYFKQYEPLMARAQKFLDELDQVKSYRVANVRL